ncbi:hypothetical protein [Rossellomorea sp. KS-H15a]|uniref:hypothetical protein n=1 Tax=Rossellomorea sp. KS-H15a TaxID=2963940 RepID=UPI0020C6EF6A|nr:hypothetical protein [Rossellomorea sp. KS-H15a]UTE76192.1 hypothetical protein M1J35_16610 [Rossellomorea sp. KS-H15a]
MEKTRSGFDPNLVFLFIRYKNEYLPNTQTNYTKEKYLKKNAYACNEGETVRMV